jgi:hypothetical protein
MLEQADFADAKLFRANLHAIKDTDARIPDRRSALKPDEDRSRAETWQARWRTG